MRREEHAFPIDASDTEERMSAPSLRSTFVPPNSKFRFIDLFAGIGGIRLGLESAGGECVYSVELDKHARQTYAANFGPVDQADIRALDPADLPKYDVLAAGFPCQPFSIAGVSKKASLGLEHGFADEKSGNLFFEVVRIIEASRPPVLFLENVKNLRSHDRGRTFKVILSELHRLGYEVAHDVVDAALWVPQHRERTFIIGLRRDVFEGRRFKFPPAPNRHRPVLRDILDSWVEEKYILTPHLWKYLQQYAAKHRAAGNGFGYGLVGGNDIARTLSARYYKDGSEILIDIAGALPRRLTPVECARLMGFPDPRQVRSGEGTGANPHVSFVIPVSDTQAYRQFGNSVVVPVIHHLALALLRQGNGIVSGAND
jgi:DNA (cytosine-5)-methyltransferase 1